MKFLHDETCLLNIYVLRLEFFLFLFYFGVFFERRGYVDEKVPQQETNISMMTLSVRL